MVLISFDMKDVKPTVRVGFTKKLLDRGWEKSNKAKTTFRWNQKHPVTAIIEFMTMVNELGLKKHITHLVVHMVRD